ncbi:MAG: STAS domain-containing protein [Planctomycetes bacterium]|nr:STAS domain-containing protein [Planctomycetota bacterium]
MFERVGHGAVDVIEGDLPLNVENVEGVASLLQESLLSGQPYVVVDLENVPLIDSAGLELLLQYQEELQRSGGALKLAAPNRLCDEILTVTGTGQSFEVFSEALLAVGSYAR